MLFVLIFFACFLHCRISADSGAEFRQEYKKLIAEDMHAEEIWQWLKSTVQSETPIEEPTTKDADEEAIHLTEPATAAANAEEKNTTELAIIGDDIESPVMYLAAQITDAPVFPVSGCISSSFGARTSPIYGYDEHHKGVDIAAKQGTTIRAVMDGIVSMVDYTPGRGNFVILDHRDTREEKIQTLYQHCLKILVEPGTVVRAGEAIALVGSTGDSTGPHLHLEYRVNGECLNPIETLFDKQYEV